jgi:hypothetical protein
VGELRIPQHPIVLLLLIIPITILVLWIIYEVIKLNSKAVALISLMLSIIDFVLWIIVLVYVAVVSTGHFFGISVTKWFYVNEFLLIVLFAITLGIYIGELDAEKTSIEFSTNLPEKTETADCKNCTQSISQNTEFCTKRGNNEDPNA